MANNDVMKFFNEMVLGEEKMKTKEDKRVVKLYSFQNQHFRHIFKNSTWSFLLVHIRFALSEGPKGFVNCFFEKSDHKCWTMKKCHLPWLDFMVHGVNQP